MSSDFYQKLQVIDNFSKVGDPQYYQSAPQDWWVVITDIKGSTKAIEEGRYKDVNQLGVATITYIKNLLGKENFLFVFGGDGATLVLSCEQHKKVQEELGLLEQLAHHRFQMELRVGAVQVQEILQQGHQLDVALLSINSQQSIAVFLGGGLTKAEEIIKSREYPTNTDRMEEEPALEGLSCRWEPLPAKRDKIASILIASQDSQNATDTYTEVLAGLDQIFDGNIDTANPVNIRQAEYTGLFKLWAEEARLQKTIFSLQYLKRFLEIFFCILCFKLNLPLMKDKDIYMQSIPSHSDYKKFDDMLRMVLDGSKDQLSQMKSFLEDLYQKDKIFYGVHESPQALMTCMVEGLGDGDHIHFIDGSDGGYAMAAKQMKAQMKA